MLKYIFPFIFLISCHSRLLIHQKPGTVVSGSAFYKEAAGIQWKQRDSLAMHYILAGIERSEIIFYPIFVGMLPG